MVSGDTPFDTEGSRDYPRILLVVCCLLAIVLAGTLVPALAGSGVGDSPLASALPGGKLATDRGSASGSGGSASLDPGSRKTPASGGTDGGASAFGALNPGASTSVGGNIAGAESAFRSQEATVHFTVRSSRPAYWRTGAYGEYTGSGWSRSGEPVPYDGSVEGTGLQGKRVSYEVTLNRSATALPSVWQPRTVAGVESMLVTDRRAFQTTRSVPPGTTYSGVSYQPPRDPQLLRASGRDYPAAIEQRYATLPESVPDRVGRFTDRLTADADNPYEEAKAIEQWLEANKAYSLNASTTSDHIADTFIFEMERGYCEYFATSMVVMLRSQGIPARYVVGYSTGQRVGENAYRVRSMNAHAWVEVYFEDVGWVKFDPTPGNARLRQERQALRRQQPDQRYAPREQGSPGEEFGLSNGSQRTPTPTPTPRPTPTPTPSGNESRANESVSISMNRSVVPGARVDVSITRDGDPVPFRVVTFNGEVLGITGQDGTVSGTVPYAEQLTVGVTRARTAGSEYGTENVYKPMEVETETKVTYRVKTNATVDVVGPVRPGSTVTVSATIDGVPIPNATVRLDGRRVGTTDEDGQARVDLPERGNVTISVVRDPVSGQTTVAIPTLTVSVRPTAPLALPLTSARVEVRLGGQPTSGVPVRLDGEQVATTGVDGTATVTLPLRGSATISAVASGTRAQATVSGLLVNLLLVLAGATLVVGGLAYGAIRRDRSPRDLLALVVRLPGLALRYAEWALVTLATRGDDLLVAAIARVRTTLGYVLALLRGQASLADLRAAFLAWYRAHRQSIERRFESTTDEQPDGETVGEARVTIREAWGRFLDHVSARGAPTKTPGELARHAIERDDLPEGAVRTLRDAFREVEYGSRSPEERLERVQRALSAIESTNEDRQLEDGD